MNRSVVLNQNAGPPPPRFILIQPVRQLLKEYCVCHGSVATPDQHVVYVACHSDGPDHRNVLERLLIAVALGFPFLLPSMVEIISLRHGGLINAYHLLPSLQQLHHLPAPALAFLDIDCCVHITLNGPRPPPVPAKMLEDLSDVALACLDSSCPLELKSDHCRVDEAVLLLHQLVDGNLECMLFVNPRKLLPVVFLLLLGIVITAEHLLNNPG